MKDKLSRSLSVFCAVVVLLSFVFCVPVFADSLNSSDFLSLVNYVPSNASDYSNMTVISSVPSGQNNIYCSVNVDGAYLFGVRSSSTKVYTVSELSHSHYDVFWYNSTGGSPVLRTFTSSFSSDYNLYYSGGTDYGTSLDYLNFPVFSTLDEGLSSARDFIDNGGSSETSPIYDDLPTFSIQRGYAAYIDFGTDWQGRSIGGTFTSTFPQYSSLISGDWDSTDNRRYFWTDSLPSNTSFSSNVGNAIDWTKVAPYDVLQRSKNGIWFIQSNTPQNRYLVIVNPNMWRYGQQASADTLNSPITVSDLDGSTGDVKFYALNQQFDSTGTLVSGQSDSAGNNRDGSYDPDTGQFNITDQDGNAAEQVPGGESDTPEIMGISDYVNQIGETLTNFANNLLNLLQKPISHIGTLINAGSGFMSALRGLYSWLPVDIQTYLISALTLVIAIGVFKVFL